MKKKKFFPALFFLSWIFALVSCASSPKFHGNGDFCGMVVDEKNQPVSEYLITCSKAGGGLCMGSTLTNQSGIFVIQNLSAGKYSLEGHKNNYTELRNLKVDFCFRDKFLCCSVLSADGLFERVNSLIKTGDFDGAKKQLELLCFQRGSQVSQVALCYEAFLYALKKDRRGLQSCLKRIRKTKLAELCKFADEVEELLNGKNTEEK